MNVFDNLTDVQAMAVIAIWIVLVAAGLFALIRWWWGAPPRKDSDGYVGVAKVHHVSASPLDRARRRVSERAVARSTGRWAEPPLAAPRPAPPTDDDEAGYNDTTSLTFPPRAS